MKIGLETRTYPFDPSPGRGSGPNVERVPTDAQIVSEVAHCHQMRSQWDRRLMKYVALVERRELYEQDGASSVEEWLSTYLGIGYRRACDFVQIALALEDLPKMDAAYAAGRLSYDHLRTLSQVANSENEQDLLDNVEGLSVGETFRLVRKILEVSAEDARDARHDRWLEMTWDHDRRHLMLNGQLPEDQGAKVERAIDALARQLPNDPAHEANPTPMGVKRADALAQMADSSLATDPSFPRVVVHVDAEVLVSGKGVAEIEDGCTISPETVRRLSCDSLLQQVVNRKDGKPIGVGRARRTVTPRMLVELKRRDPTCRFPGCRRRKLLHAHHLIHWADGGPTDYDNLALVCETHHYMIHEGGFTIRGDPPKTWVERPGLPPIKVGPPPLHEETAASFGMEVLMAMNAGNG